MPGPPVGQNKRLTPHQPKPRDDGGKLIDLARAAYGGWSDIEHRRNVQMHAQIKKSKDKPDIFEKAGNFIYGFVKSTINNDIKDARRIYKEMPNYAKDRLWAMVPYHFLPEDRKRKLDSQPQIAADWKGGFLKALLDDIMNEGAANIYAKTGAKFKNASLDTPFSKIFQATAKKVPGPGRVLKVGPEDTDSFGIAWGGRGTGWPNEDPTYLRRPWVNLPEKGGYTLVLPKGAEHYQAGRYAEDIWGSNVYDYVAPGKLRVEYDRMGNRIQNATQPQHGWLYRDTPTSMNLETGITDSGKGADSIYNLVKTILENGEDFGDVEATAGYWNRYNNYQPYQPPSEAYPESSYFSSSVLRRNPSSLGIDLPPYTPPSLKEALDELFTNVPGSSAMVRDWTPQQIMEAQSVLRRLKSPNAAQASFLRWLDEQGISPVWPPRPELQMSDPNSEFLRWLAANRNASMTEEIMDALGVSRPSYIMPRTSGPGSYNFDSVLNYNQMYPQWLMGRH